MIINADEHYEFSFVRKSATISAYGEEFVLPVRNAKFLDKLIEADKKISRASATRVRAEAYRTAIACFIPEEKVDIIFPISEIDTLDLDELQAFYEALCDAVKQHSQNLIKRNYTKNENLQ